MQYTTRDVKAMKADAKKIAKNMAPLIGCKVGESTWAPFTGVNVCKALSVVGLECSNVSSEVLNTGLIQYKFTSGITVAAADFWRAALAYDPIALSSSYIMYVNTIIPVGAEISARLKLTADYCIYTDSTIFDTAYKNDAIRLTAVYARICHILLSCFTLRYFLNEYSKDATAELDVIEVNETVINRIIGNIDYVKNILGQDETVEIEYRRSVSYARQHLTTLRKNLMMIPQYILQYISV